jgi:lysophospholipase L1-like esterase
MEIEVTTIAKTGWTAAELGGVVEATEPEPPFDMVSVQVGVNDQYRGRPVEAYVADLRPLLGRAIRLTEGRPGRVMVLSIPDWTVTPHAADRDRDAEGRTLETYNLRLREETLRAGCRWVDVTAASRTAAEPGLLAPDGLHPSREMYRRWVQHLVPVAVEVLRAS